MNACAQCRNGLVRPKGVIGLMLCNACAKANPARMMTEVQSALALCADHGFNAALVSKLGRPVVEVLTGGGAVHMHDSEDVEFLAAELAA